MIDRLIVSQDLLWLSPSSLPLIRPFGNQDSSPKNLNIRIKPNRKERQNDRQLNNKRDSPSFLSMHETVPVHVKWSPVFASATVQTSRDPLVQVAQHNLWKPLSIHSDMQTLTFLSCLRSFPVNSVRISRKARLGGAPPASLVFSSGFAATKMPSL